MAIAKWHGVVLAESDQYEIVEGNIYFPPDSINQQYLVPSDTHTICFWKGRASYFDIEVKGETNKDAAWYYPSPTNDAENIKGYIAFWKGIEISE